MAEKSFDEVLRQALLDANWRQWQPLWEGAEEPAFSPAYRRWRMRLLSDPFGWVKKRLRPLRARVLRTAACLLLASAVALGSLMAVSPTVRAAVLGWLREITGNMISYTSSYPDEEASPTYWRPSWLPEGWKVESIRSSGWYYRGESVSKSLSFAYYQPGSRIGTSLSDVSDAEDALTTIQIQGYRADYFCSDGYRILLWENEDDYLFMLQARTSAMSEEDFLRVAENVAPYSAPDIAYQIRWVPPEYEPFSYDEIAGAAEGRWNLHQTSLTWRYMIDPICPFVLPEGTPEEILLDNGLTAQYWAAQEPAESGSTTITVGGEEIEFSDNTIVIGDVTIGMSGDAPAEQTGTLVWSDPETNTSFLLEGPLGRQDLVEIAQSITTTEPDIDPLPEKTFQLSGTTYAG